MKYPGFHIFRSGVFVTVIALPFLLFAQQSCRKLAVLKIPNTTITSAENVPAGSIKMPSLVRTVNTIDLPAYCRVKGVIAPTSDSKILFEVWMPLKAWTGTFVQVGNGGLAGSIPHAAMDEELAHNFAVAGTDDGHQGLGTDGSWAIGHPEKVKDFGYRAVHETSETSKQIIAAFYPHPSRYSYFNGCSEGGREALMEAQRFPDDFSGILVGSPAHAWMQLMANFAWNAQALLKDSGSYIPESKRPAIEEAALKACGTQDGFTSNFIKEPLACHFDPSVLLCKGPDSNDCLTSKQLTALKKIYAGPKNPRTGKQISPGYEPGAEAEPGPVGISYASYIYGSTPQMNLDHIFSSSFYGGFVFADPHYDSLNLNFDKDIELATKKVGAVLDATNPDLKPFLAHGGKMIHYEGWYDGSPTPLASVDYYRSVVKTMGGLKNTRKFYRLYMAPGMMHCGFGPGPNYFGNMVDTSHFDDPNRNVFAALRAWVEHGRVPESIIATKYVNNNPAQPVVMTRPLCPFPEQAKWNHKGNTNDGRNFSCQSPDKNNSIDRNK